ncbi:MAG: NHL repeat-containing protein [Nitrospinae bacterium]|nr:NHL repeat-containing protein [Nitrospinota bacterium]
MTLIASLSGDKIMGKFNQPSTIFFDESKKRLYVADTGNNRLVSFDPDFNFISEFDAGGELKYPMSAVRNSKEQFFVIGGPEKNGLFLIDISKKIFKQFDIRDAPARENPILPWKLAIDKNDTLYIIDKANGRILVVDSDGRYLREIKFENKFIDFSDVRVDADGNIYSLSTLERKIYIFNNKGVFISSFGKMGNKVNEFEFPVSIAISPNGFIYVLDQHKGSVLTFKKDGVFQSSFSKNKWKNQGELYKPYYIFADMGNKIYIVDRGNNRIQIFQGGK